MGRRCLMIVAACSIVCGVSYARRMAWKHTEKPPVSLRLALTLAEEALEEEDVHYFCVGAGLAKTFSAGDWAFHFSSTGGKAIWVNVSSGRKVKKSKHGFEY